MKTLIRLCVFDTFICWIKNCNEDDCIKANPPNEYHYVPKTDL